MHSWWTERCNAGEIPTRRSFDPIDHASLSNSLVVSEFEPHSHRIRYRQVGAKAAAAAGFDYTGCYLDEVLVPGLAAAWSGYYASATKAREPLLGEECDPTIGGGALNYEFGIFPLFCDRRKVCEFITVEDYFGSRQVSAGFRRRPAVLSRLISDPEILLAQMARSNLKLIWRPGPGLDEFELRHADNTIPDVPTRVSDRALDKLRRDELLVRVSENGEDFYEAYYLTAEGWRRAQS